MSSSATKYTDNYKRLGHIVNSLVLFLSIIVLIGWATGTYEMVRLIPNLAQLGLAEKQNHLLPLLGQLNSTSAILLCLISLSLTLLNQRQIVWKILLGKTIAVFVIVSTLIGIYGELTGEEILSFRVLRPEPSAPGITFPNPIMIPEAVCLAVVGTAIVLYVLDKKYSIVSQCLALLSTIIPILILIGFSTGSPQLCSMGACFQLSLAFSLLILFAASSILLLSSEHGMLTLFSSTTTGGKIIRRASILLLAIPFLLLIRFLLISININGYPLVEETMSWALFGLTLVSLAGFLTYNGAKLAEDADLATQKSNNKLDKMTNSSQSRSFSKICIECGKEFDSSELICPIDGAPLSETHKLNLIGKVFADKYKIEKMLGEGGMSSVYLAKHLVLDRFFAIKVLKKSVINSLEDLERFKREAKIASKIKHNSIVHIQDFGVSSDGLPYIAMEHISGVSLEELIDQKAYVSPEQALNILSKVAEPLAQAHSLGIVHRDLKASNIMIVGDLTDKFTVKLVDFGIAKIVSKDIKESQNLTLTGEALGSPLYMSPEQCSGVAIDQRSDIYSMACLAYYLVVGYPPLVGKTVNETMALHMTAKPAEIPLELNIPKGFSQVIFKSLSKNASDRHQQITEFVKDLKASIR